MAHPTAFKHQGMIALNRHNGSCVMLTMEEAAAITALCSPGHEARAAAERHLEAHRNPLGTRHGDPLSPEG